MILRSELFKLEFRFRVHRNDLPGKPDIVLPKYNVIIFVHGCFWHFHQQCSEGRIPSTNSGFWRNKLQKNISRDDVNIKALTNDGWKVSVVWECEIENHLNRTIRKLILELKK